MCGQNGHAHSMAPANRLARRPTIVQTLLLPTQTNTHTHTHTSRPGVRRIFAGNFRRRSHYISECRANTKLAFCCCPHAEEGKVACPGGGKTFTMLRCHCAAPTHTQALRMEALTLGRVQRSPVAKAGQVFAHDRSIRLCRGLVPEVVGERRFFLLPIATCAGHQRLPEILTLAVLNSLASVS